jgi:hypothetical protein
MEVLECFAQRIVGRLALMVLASSTGRIGSTSGGGSGIGAILPYLRKSSFDMIHLRVRIMRSWSTFSLILLSAISISSSAFSSNFARSAA